MTKKVLVFLFEGFSDWEIAYVTPEISKSQDFGLLFFTIDGKPVKSMGGMQVLPDASLQNINYNDATLLILPGGTAWEKGKNSEAERLCRKMHEQEKYVAAICAAGTFLARLGMLDNIRHTSNDLGYLKSVAPEYRGDKLYQDSLAVTDHNIITAKGIAPIEFACEIFKAIGLYQEDKIEKWFQLFKNGIWSE